MSDHVLPCLACGGELEPAFRENPKNEPAIPYGGTVFHTYGHYGSTAFHPMDDSYLEITICDVCLSGGAATERVWHLRDSDQPAYEEVSETWHPAGQPATADGCAT